MADPVLSLQTITQHATVEVDEVKYRLLPTAALSLFDSIQQEGDQVALGELLQRSDTLNEAQKAEVSRLLNRICRRILDAPESVQAKLTEPMQMLVINAFTELPLNRRRQTAEAEEPAHPSNGERRSRASRVSMEAASTSGTGRSRSASSGRRTK